MTTICGDSSGYVIDFEAMAVALHVRGWKVRRGADAEGPRDLMAIFNEALEGELNPDHWELLDRETGEVVAVSEEAAHDLLIGALASLLGEVLPEEEFLQIVTVSPSILGRRK